MAAVVLLKVAALTCATASDNHATSAFPCVLSIGCFLFRQFTFQFGNANRLLLKMFEFDAQLVGDVGLRDEVGPGVHTLRRVGIGRRTCRCGRRGR